MTEVNFGQYALPVVLTVVLALIYKIATTISDRAKPIIAVLCGIGLGVLGLFYNAVDPIFKNVVDYVLYGFMTGCTAVGLWEITRATVHPPK